MISALIGKTLVKIDKINDKLIFHTSSGERYRMHHYQDCCENVYLEDVCGELDDLLNTPILAAYESTNKDNPPEDVDSFTWTFYHIRTVKGTVTLRWLGESNGYYSEDVDFELIT